MKKSILIMILFAAQVLFLNAQERKDLSVTIYNSDLGVVREKRVINVPAGISEVRIVDIPENIDPTSVLVKFNGTLLEQNYQYDLVNVIKILNRYIGLEVTLMSPDKTVYGTLLAANNFQLVVKTKDGNIMMFSDMGKFQVVVKDLPNGLITKPTLVWKIDSKKSGDQEFEITYSVTGMTWHAEYVALLNENDTKMDLNSWVSLENRSGGSYPGTELKLIAGDINRIAGFENRPMANGRMVEMKMADAAKSFEEKSLFEYHIYNLERPTDLLNLENKQISLFNAQNVSIEKKFKYNTSLFGSSENNKVAVVVEFKNSDKNNLGIPMPKGKIRVFKSDGNSKEFVGEDLIDHTPKDEVLKVKVGEAFDVLVDEIMEQDKKITRTTNEREITLKIKNRKNEKISVEIESNMGWGNWEILESTAKYTKKNANTVIFNIGAEKSSETLLKIKVRNTY